MSIVTRVRDLIAHAINHGHANEFAAPVQEVLHELADEIHKLGNGGVDVEALAEKVIASLGEKIDQRIEVKFAELLEKAAAADQPKGDAAAPAEPALQA